ncbi:uncharacterized protein LOC134865578 isoform X2 [Eleginops maclovinus]
MAATVNTPRSAHPEPSRVHVSSWANSCGPTSDPHDPGLHGPRQAPRPPPHPQHHIPARPVFYVHAPPPPPFHPYEWPMHFSHNPFAGFPGMGIGMAMPQFPPPTPYMEVPAYIMPHPHMQPVDYRRVIHPQAQAPSAPYQNPYQTCRVRPHLTVPVRETVNSAVQTEPQQRETVNSAVQTEPQQRGGSVFGEESPLPNADSDRETVVNCPLCSSTNSRKQHSAEVENYALHSSNAKGLQVRGTSNVLQPTVTTAIQSCIGATLVTQKSQKESVGRENVSPCRNAHCNVLSIGSQDGMVPVFSSSQQEEAVYKERRISVLDTLMSGGDVTPQLKMADKLPQNDLATEGEQVKSVPHSGVETRNGPEVADPADDAQCNFISKHSEVLLEVLKLSDAEVGRESRNDDESLGLFGSVWPCLPYADELLQSSSHNTIESNPHEDTAPISPCINNSSYLKRPWNASIWSVESLAPFIPTKEWLLQNSVLAADVIVEEADNDNLIVKSRKKRSSSDTSLSDSWLLFSTPTGKTSPRKEPEIECDMEASDMGSRVQAQSVAPSEKGRSASPNDLQSKMILSTPTAEDTNRSSEPEAIQSPNQDILNEQQNKRTCSHLQEKSPRLNPTEEKTCARRLNLQNGADINLEDEHMGTKKMVGLQKRSCASQRLIRRQQKCLHRRWTLESSVMSYRSTSVPVRRQGAARAKTGNSVLHFQERTMESTDNEKVPT